MNLIKEGKLMKMIVDKSKKSYFCRLQKVDLKSTTGGGLNRILFQKLGNLGNKVKYKNCGKLKNSLIILFCTFLF